MEKWVLTVGYDKEKFNDAQSESLKYGIFIRMATDTSEAVALLTKNNNFLLVVIFSDGPDYLNSLKVIRSLTKAPILMMRHQYNGTEKIAAIAAGTDEYIQWPETIPEGMASCRALIRRYMELNQQANEVNTLLRDGVFISLDYRKVFINTHEIELPRREFDLFFGLVSAPDRVFTYEQLSKQVWGNDYVATENSLHSCVHRIRKKLESIPEVSCCIKNIRGIGYCFKQKET